MINMYDKSRVVYFLYKYCYPDEIAFALNCFDLMTFFEKRIYRCKSESEMRIYLNLMGLDINNFKEKHHAPYFDSMTTKYVYVDKHNDN